MKTLADLHSPRRDSAFRANHSDCSLPSLERSRIRIDQNGSPNSDPLISGRSVRIDQNGPTIAQYNPPNIGYADLIRQMQELPTDVDSRNEIGELKRRYGSDHYKTIPSKDSTATTVGPVRNSRFALFAVVGGNVNTQPSSAVLHIISEELPSQCSLVNDYVPLLVLSSIGQ